MYRIEESKHGHFAVLEGSGAAVEAFPSRRQATRFINGRVAEDKLLEAARQFIGVATNNLMRRHRINRATARLWIREAVDSGD